METVIFHQIRQAFLVEHRLFLRTQVIIYVNIRNAHQLITIPVNQARISHVLFPPFFLLGRQISLIRKNAVVVFAFDALLGAWLLLGDSQILFYFALFGNSLFLLCFLVCCVLFFMFCYYYAFYQKFSKLIAQILGRLLIWLLIFFAQKVQRIHILAGSRLLKVFIIR